MIGSQFLLVATSIKKSNQKSGLSYARTCLDCSPQDPSPGRPSRLPLGPHRRLRPVEGQSSRRGLGKAPDLPRAWQWLASAGGSVGWLDSLRDGLFKGTSKWTLEKVLEIKDKIPNNNCYCVICPRPRVYVMSCCENIACLFQGSFCTFFPLAVDSLNIRILISWYYHVSRTLNWFYS